VVRLGYSIWLVTVSTEKPSPCEGCNERTTNNQVSSANPQLGNPIKLGRPVQFTASNHLLFRIDEQKQKMMLEGRSPQRLLGQPVVDSSFEKIIGKVYDIFGPVATPFLTVQLSNEAADPAALIDASYFIRPEPARARYQQSRQQPDRARARYPPRKPQK